ncbi:MAG: HlyD family secretion protein [Candidatus Obscuribacterales bacterium]
MNSLYKAGIAGALIVSLAGCRSYVTAVTDPKDVTMKGSVETEEAYIRNEAPAEVKSIPVREGQIVSKGDVLVVLDDSQLRHDLARLEDHLASTRKAAKAASRNLDEGKKHAEKLRNKGFFGKLFSTRKGREKKKNEVKNEITEAKTFLIQSEEQKKVLKEKAASGRSLLEKFRIESPVDGVVSVISVSPGENVKPGQILLSVARSDSSYFRSRVCGKEKDLLAIDDTGLLYLDNSEEGIPVRIDDIADQSAFTPEHAGKSDDGLQYCVRLSFLDPTIGARLRPGTRGVVRFKEGSRIQE